MCTGYGRSGRRQAHPRQRLAVDQLIYEKNRCVHLSVIRSLRRQVLRQPGPGSPVHKGWSPSRRLFSPSFKLLRLSYAEA